MDKEKVRQVAKSIMFDIDDKVLDSLTEFFEEHLKAIDDLKSIDTEGVLPMTRIDNTPISFLREDTPEKALDKEKLLSNAGETFKGYVVVPKKEAQND